MLQERVREGVASGELLHDDLVAELAPLRQGGRHGQVADALPGGQQRLAIRVGDDRVRVDLRRAVETAAVEQDPVVRLVRDDPDWVTDAG